jgi:hypothetical protein
MSLRGILRGFGLKVGPTTSQSFAARINHLVDGHTSLEAVAAALLSLHAVALREFKSLERSVRVQLRLHTGAFVDRPWPLEISHQRRRQRSGDATGPLQRQHVGVGAGGGKDRRTRCPRFLATTINGMPFITARLAQVCRRM